MNKLLAQQSQHWDREAKIGATEENRIEEDRLRSGSRVALMRLFPLLFPIIFISAAIKHSISMLYAAIALHIIVIMAENTFGRLFANVPVNPLFWKSTLFEDICLLIWPTLHLTTLAAMLYLIINTSASTRQVFAVGAIFGYSINTFGATVGHELFHRRSKIAWICSDILYAAMLYPHFPTVHLSSHHKWAGTDRDCQTPLPGQQIYRYLCRSLIGGLRIALSARAAVLDPHLYSRTLGAVLGTAMLSLVGGWRTMMFLVVQGLFSFIIIETLNYIQHYKHPGANIRAACDRLANQDVNFISRCALFNMPLHAAHHIDQNSHYSRLTRISGAQTHCWGYWTSFWLAWTPPLWNQLYVTKGVEAD